MRAAVALVAVGSIVSLAVFAPLGEGAPTPVPMTDVCVNNSSGGLFFPVGDATPTVDPIVCASGQTPKPVDDPSSILKTCYLNSNGAIREVAPDVQCVSAPRSKKETARAVPSLTQDLYFCASTSGGALFFKGTSPTSCKSRQFLVVVEQANDPPAADPQSVSLDEDTTKLITLTGSDPDGNAITFSVTDLPDHGKLYKGSSTSAADEITAVPAALGTGTDVTYEPDADYAGSDSFQFVANDGFVSSPAATVSITVDPVNDAPVAHPQSVTLDEDDAGKLITLAGSDVDGDALSFVVTALPASGTLYEGNSTASGAAIGVLDLPKTLSGDEVTYAPAANYAGPDSFAFHVSDGTVPSADATVSITVQPVNDPPTATPQTVTVAEDTSKLVTLAGADAESDPLTFAVTTLPANGALYEGNSTAAADRIQAGDLPKTLAGNQVTYLPAANFNGADAFDFTAGDGTDTSAPATVSITVGAVNDPPSIDDATFAVDENSANGTQVGSVPVNDPDTGDSHTYSITAGNTGGAFAIDNAGDLTVANSSALDFETNQSFALTVHVEDSANATDTAAITVNLNDVNDAPVAVDDLYAADGAGSASATAPGVLANDTDADGDTLSAVLVSAPSQASSFVLNSDGSFTYQAAPASTGSDSFTYKANDGSADSNVATVTINLSAVPVAEDVTVSDAQEDTPKTITLTASDGDGDALTFTAVDPSNGSLDDLTPTALCGVVLNTCTAQVTYTPDPDFSGSDSFTYTANDGQADSAPATVSITVNAVNDAPVLSNVEAGALAYTENDPATIITSTTTVADADSADFDTGALTVDYSVGGTADDRLEIRDSGTGAGQIGVAGSTVTYGGTTIGAVTGGTGTTPLVVTLNANATPAAAQALIRNVTYRNVSDSPSAAARTARFVLSDGDGATSNATTRAISLTAVDDPPVLAGIEAGALAYTENDPATAVTSSLTVTDPDGNIAGATVSITANLASSEDELSFTPQLGITGSYDGATGVLTLTGSASPADYQTALRAVRYRNLSENPSTATRTISFQATGSNTITRGVTVTAVNDAPVADDETFNGTSSAVGNTALVVDDPDDGAPALNAPKKSISGDVLNGDTDVDGPGPLAITPGAFATNDGGSVTIEADGDFVFTPAAGTSCTDTSDFFDYTLEDSGSPEQTDTGRVTIAIAGCVWYVSNNAAGNSGTSTAPFDTLAQAETASAANHTVFVFDGDNTATGYGGDGYSMNNGERLISEHEGLVVGADTLYPANPGAKPTVTASNADVIDLGSGDEVRGFVLDPQGTGGGIGGLTGDAGGTFDDIDINDTGTVGTQPGLELNGTSGTFTISNLTVSTSGSTGVRLNNAGTVAFAPAGTISIATTGAKALEASGTNMGTSTFDSITVTGSGNGGVSMTSTTGTTTFGDLALTTTSGAAAAFLLSSAGTVSVPGAGTANVNATGGPAVDVTGTSGATLDFDAVSSTNSGSDGINLGDLGTGTFSAASGSIGGAAGIAFDLDGGSGTVSYPGAINNGAGASVEITNRTGGTVAFSGAITDTNDAGGGITLVTNTGATMNFSGGVALSTGASAAFAATGGGTVNVTGTNTLESTTGTALNLTGTNIGASGLTFRSIASNGAASGIVLNGTGASGGLTVSGNGGTCTSAATCTGGAIQNSSGPGISLTSVGGGVSLTRVSVNNGGDDGIRGSSVSGLSLANSVILSNGNAVGERGIDMVELSGSGGLSSTTVSGSSENNVTIANDTANLTAYSVTGSTISNTNMTTGDDGILVLDNGSAAMAVSVTGSTFTDNKGDHFQAASDASSTGSIDVTFDNNTLTTTAANDPSVVGGGITINPGSANDISFKIRGNNIQQAFDDAINLNLDPSSTAAGSLVGTVSGNTIGTAGQAGSGSESSNTITLRAAGQGLARVAIQNNTIREWTNAHGISIATAEGSADIDATVTGNSIKNPDPVLGLNGIRVDAGATAGPPADDGVICAAITGNDATGTGVAGAPDIRLRQRFATTIRLPGYVGANNNDAAVETFVSGNNTGSPVVDATNNVAGGGGGFTGGAACPLPPA